MNLIKKLKNVVATFAIGAIIASSLGTSVFADNVKIIPKGVGEISILGEERASGTTSSPYISSLSMGDQVIDGASRSYNSGYHNIKIKLVDRGNSDGPNKCRVTLKRTSLGSSGTIGAVNFNLVKKGTTYSTKFVEKQTSGKYKYVFDNRASLFGWDNIDYIDANPVTMFTSTN